MDRAAFEAYHRQRYASFRQLPALLGADLLLVAVMIAATLPMAAGGDSMVMLPSEAATVGVAVSVRVMARRRRGWLVAVQVLFLLLLISWTAFGWLLRTVDWGVVY